MESTIVECTKDEVYNERIRIVECTMGETNCVNYLELTEFHEFHLLLQNPIGNIYTPFQTHCKNEIFRTKRKEGNGIAHLT